MPHGYHVYFAMRDMFVWAVCKATSQAVLESCFLNSMNWTEIVYLLVTSVQVLFFILNAIQLYELCAIKLKGGFFTSVVFSSTYAALTKSTKFVHKACVFRKKDQKNTQHLSKKATAIRVFILNQVDYKIRNYCSPTSF